MVNNGNGDNKSEYSVIMLVFGISNVPWRR